MFCIVFTLITYILVHVMRYIKFQRPDLHLYTIVPGTTSSSQHPLNLLTLQIEHTTVAVCQVSYPTHVAHE